MSVNALTDAGATARAAIGSTSTISITFSNTLTLAAGADNSADR